MILLINLFLFFLLPFLVLFLTRKRPIPQMVLWTALVQVIVLFARTVVYPIVLPLSWGIPFSEAASLANLSNWYSGSGIQLLYLAVASILVTVIAILCTAIYRKKTER